MLRTILITAPVILGFGPSGIAGEILQGDWLATKAKRNGKAADEIRGHLLTFAGNQFVIRGPNSRQVLYQGTYTIDAGKKPAAIDFRHTKGFYKGKVWKGIYSLRDGALKICDNAPALENPRPTDFLAKAGSGDVVVYFQRSNSGKASRSKAEKEITAALKKLNQAFKTQDAAAIKRLFTADHLSIQPYYSKPQKKEVVLKNLEKFKITKQTIGKFTIRFPSKSVALVTYRMSIEGSYRGRPLFSPNLVSCIWVNHEGAWKEAFYQETPYSGK